MLKKAQKHKKDPSKVQKLAIIRISEYDAWNRFHELADGADIGLPESIFVVAFHRRFAKK